MNEPSLYPRSKSQAIGYLVGAMTDWLGIAAMWHLASIKVVDPGVATAAIVGLASGTIVSKLRKGVTSEGSGSTSVALFAFLPALAKAWLAHWSTRS